MLYVIGVGIAEAGTGAPKLPPEERNVPLGTILYRAADLASSR